MMLVLDPLRTAPYPNPNEVWVVMRGEGTKTWGFIPVEKNRLYLGGRNAMTRLGHALVTGFRVCATMPTPKEAASADESH